MNHLSPEREQVLPVHLFKSASRHPAMPREVEKDRTFVGGSAGRGTPNSVNVRLPKIGTLWMALHLAKPVPKLMYVNLSVLL